MKTKPQNPFFTLALLAFCTLHSALSSAEAQGTAFTYQGRLNTNAVPANGFYDFQFSLSNAPSGGVQVGSTGLVNFAATGTLAVLQPYLACYKPSGTGVGTLLADYVRAWMNRS